MTSAVQIAAQPRSFDLEAGNASTTLREFAREARVDVVMDRQDVQGVQTNEVSGLLAPRLALERMLKGTQLVFKEDLETGAFAVTRSKAPASDSTTQGSEVQTSEPEQPLNETGMNVRNNNWFKSLLAAIIVGPTASSTTLAQVEEQPVYELSPFEIDASSDMGYLATNTLTGSRLRTNLADVAASVSVFTEEFLNDTGLNDVQELVLYSVSMVNNTQETNASPNINNYLGAAEPVRGLRIRGVSATKATNYFESYLPDDGFRVERYDESRGPNGILFGISGAGGVVNTSTLRANTETDSLRLRYTIGSYSENRFETRFNKVIIDEKLAFSVAALDQDNGGWRDYERDDRERFYGAITWKPMDNLTLQVLGETGETFGTRIRPYSATDTFLAWWLLREKFGVDAVTFIPGTGGGRDGATPGNDEEPLGIQRIQPAIQSGQPRGNFIYNATDGVLRNGAGLWQTVSFENADTASLADILAANSVEDLDGARSNVAYRDPAKILNYEKYGFDYPRRLNAGGPDMWRTEDFNSYTIMADYRITDDLYFNLAFNHQETEITAQFDDASRPEIRGDPNKTLYQNQVASAYGIDPSTPNPRVGQLYFDSQWRYQWHDIDYDEIRGALSYDFDFADHDMGWLGRHRFAAGWSKREVSDQLLGTRYGFLGNPFDLGAANATDFDDTRNRIYVRSYLTEGNFDTYRILPPPLDMTSFVTEDGVNRPVGWIHENAGTLNARSDIEVTSTIFALQSRFWNDRLVATLGWREDEADNTAFGHVLDPLFGETLTEDPNAPGYRVDDPIEAETKTAGLVFHLTDNFSLIASYATSIGLPEFRNVVFPDQGIAPPIEGEGMDFGVAFNFLDNRISGRLVRFDTEERNGSVSGGGTRIISNPMRDSMRALNEVREFDSTIIRKPDGTPYSDSEWEQEINDLNGASGEGLSPLGAVNSFLQDNNSDGWELTVTANITDNWRISVNASHTDRLLSNYGREFAKSAGWQKDENGRYINPVTVNTGQNEATAVDRSVLTPGSIHDRILEIANNAQGTLILEDESTRVINPGDGALLINTDDSFAVELNTDESVAYRLWESLSGSSNLQVNIDEREKRWGLQPWKFNVFTAYDFKQGLLKGFTMGGGFRYLDGAIIGEDFNGNELTSQSEKYVDLMLRYRQKLEKGTIDYQLNVYNALDEDDIIPVRYAILEDPSSPLSRFKFVDPVTVRASVSYSF